MREPLNRILRRVGGMNGRELAHKPERALAVGPLEEVIKDRFSH